MQTNVKSEEVEDIFTDKVIRDAIEATEGYQLQQNFSMDAFKYLLVNNTDKLRNPPFKMIQLISQSLKRFIRELVDSFINLPAQFRSYFSLAIDDIITSIEKDTKKYVNELVMCKI